MVTKILPEYQKKVKVSLDAYWTKCGYDDDTDTIKLNLKKLHKNKTNFKEDLEKWLEIKLTFRQFIVFCLLHELGHRLRFLRGKFNEIEYNRQSASIDYEIGTYPYRKEYWNITEEKIAMDYAKKYFKKYLQVIK